MELFSILISLFAIIISGVAIYLSMDSKSITKKFLGDDNEKEKISENLIKHNKETKDALSHYKDTLQTIKQLEESNKSNLSAYAIHRFNPYEDTGGDLSFCLVLLNRNADGVMVTSLHARERTRIYTRTVQNAKINSEILFDEEETLKQAFDQIK